MQQVEVQRENKMGVMPIPKLLITMALPMIISMMVQAFYNIVDSYFVSKVSQDAFNALSLSYPIQMLMISVGAGTGIGINALLSRNLGEKKFEEANKTAQNGIFLSVLSFLVFAIFGFFFSRAFFQSQIDNQNIIEAGTSYLSICTIGSLGIFVQIVMERLLQSTGKTVYSMITQGIGAIINIILDPILIFGLLGMPKLGVAGAAIATVIGQLVAMSLGIYFNIAHNKEISIKVKTFRPDIKTIKSIYLVGIPSIIMQSIGSIMLLGMNSILLSYSTISKESAESAVFVFGVYFKLQSFVFMPIIGLNNGMIPILAYNYGAGKKKRIMSTVKLSIAIGLGIMLTGLAVFQLIPDKLLELLRPEGADFTKLLHMGIPALQTISLSFIFGGFCIVILAVFQALGSGFLSLFVSITRQLIVILPVAYFLMKSVGISGVWWAFPIAEVVAFLMSILFFRYLYKNKISKIQ